MPDDRIQFRCETCGKKLRAPISKAGAQSECPQCGDLVTVPLSARPRDGETLAKYDPTGSIDCPVCGAEVDANAADCPACGELLGGMGEDPTGMRRSGPIEVTLGSVWRAAVEDWKEQFGILLAGFLLAGLVSFAVTMSLYFGMIVVMFGGMAVVGGAGGGGEAAGVMVVLLAVLGGLLFFGAIVACNSWMTLGLAGMHLEAVRTRPELGTLFRTPGFWRMVLCGTILGIFGTVLGYLPTFAGIAFVGNLGGGGGAEAVILGLFYLVPMVVFGGMFLLFWPVPFFCIDRPDIGHVRPLWAAIQMPAGAWGGHLAVGAAAYGLLMAGYMLCGVGLLFTGPLAGLLLAHAYDRFDRAETDARGPRALDPEGVI